MTNYIIEMMDKDKLSERQGHSLRMKPCFLPSPVTSTSENDNFIEKLVFVSIGSRKV